MADLGGGASVANLAETLGGHPNTTRHHLRSLLDEGLVRAEAGVPSGGRGRPTARYAVSPAGRLTLSAAHGEEEAAQYLALAGAFAERLASTGGDPGADARAIGRTWASMLTQPATQASARAGQWRDAGAAPRPGATSPSEPRQAVLGLLERLGFSPEESEPGRDASGEGGDPDVLLRTCPLLEVATRHPGVVCQVHAGLVAGSHAAHGGSGEGVVLEPFALPGACRLTLPATR